jgi:3-oxoacyl-[acyl-carrier-protein] synthase II
MKAYIQSLESLSKSQLALMLARKRQEETQGIAVIGMSCRFPGGIDHPEKFWDALQKKRVVTSERRGLPTDSLGRPRWNLEAPDIAPLSGILQSGAYLESIDTFDADYFGLKDDEVLHMDPQQRLLLMCAVEAMADANITRRQLQKIRTGVFTGVSAIEYNFAGLRNGLGVEDLSPHMGTGNTLSATAAQIALQIGANGPVLAIDTACSSALTALHLACVSLRRGECDLAVVASCHLILSPLTTGVFMRAGMLSPSGHSRPFLANADGHARSEGCGAILLKRVSDAQNDKNLIHGVVRSSAVYQQGDRSGMSVSSGESQRRVIEKALKEAEMNPDQVHYVEAQGTGSKLGGVIEAETLARVYNRDSVSAPPLYIGSCKANLGHMEVASGIAGLVKTLLAIQKGTIPPQPDFSQPDPTIPWQLTGLRVATESSPWPKTERRVAAVSGFGFTGTNVHVLIEEAPASRQVTPTGGAGQPELFVLSAHNRRSLCMTAARLHDYLSLRSGWTHAEVCRTLAVGRELLGARHACVVSGRDELLATLNTLSSLNREEPGSGSLPQGVSLFAAEQDREALGASLALCNQPGFAGLRRQVLRFAAIRKLINPGDDMIPDATALTPENVQEWSFLLTLAWIQELRELNFSIVQAQVEDQYDSQICEVLVGTTQPEKACTERVPGLSRTETALNQHKRTRESGNLWRLTVQPQPQAATLSLPGLNRAKWLEFLAHQVSVGTAVQLSRVWNEREEAFLRLPANAWISRRFWPEHNIWS